MKVANKYKAKSSIDKNANRPEWHIGKCVGWATGSTGHQAMQFETYCRKTLSLYFHDKKKADQYEDYDKKTHREFICPECVREKRRRIANMRARVEKLALQTSKAKPGFDAQ